jgi:hypothetical protein
MSLDFAFGLYVFCMDFHSGQSSRLYRILSKLRVSMPDSAIAAVRRGRDDPHGEWEQARIYYRELKRKYANDRR